MPELIPVSVAWSEQVFLLGTGWDASPSQGYSQQYIRRYPFIHLGEEKHCESKVSSSRTLTQCFGQDSNPDHSIGVRPISTSFPGPTPLSKAERALGTRLGVGWANLVPRVHKLLGQRLVDRIGVRRIINHQATAPPTHGTPVIITSHGLNSKWLKQNLSNSPCEEISWF